jgi:integrase
MAEGEWVDPARGGVKLTQYANAWLETRRVQGRPLALRTHDTYRNSLDKWVLPRLGGAEVRNLTAATIRRWHADMTAVAGPTASRQAYSLLRAILNTAVDEDMLRRNPCRVRGAGQSRSSERPLLDLQAVGRLTEAMPQHLRCLVCVAFWAHARIGEVIALRREDLDLAAGTLQIRRQQVEVAGRGPVIAAPKAASVRTVHLPEPAVEALRAHLVARGPLLPSAPLFTGLTGGTLRAGQVQWAWRQARTQVGLPEVHFHDLRHAGLTLTAQSGATLAEVMRRAGHASSAAALRYQHAADRRDAEIAARLTSFARQGTSGGA